MGIEAIAAASLPKDWRHYPAPAQLKQMGAYSLVRASSLVLCLPPAINSVEANLLLNPAHAEMKKLKVVDE